MPQKQKNNTNKVAKENAPKTKNNLKNSKPSSLKKKSGEENKNAKAGGGVVKKLSQQTKSKMQKIANPLAGAVNEKKPSRKTQGLANKVKQSNIKKAQKEKAAGQNKSRGNLKNLVGNKASHETRHIEGVVKKTDSVLKMADKNNSTDIKGNVIGKQPDLKVIGNKMLMVATAVLAVLLLASVVSNFVFYGVFKHKAETPMFNVTGELNMSLENSFVQVASLTVPRNILPTSVLPQVISVNTDKCTAAQVFRFRVMFTTAGLDGRVLSIEQGDNFTHGADGYFYFNEPVAVGLKKTICNSIELPQEIRLGINGVSLNVVTVVCESQNVNRAIVESVWSTAPAEWLEVVF